MAYQIDFKTDFAQECATGTFDLDVSLLIDQHEAAYYADGRFQVSPLKLFKKYRRQIDFMGYRHLTADPCQIDCWLNCSETGSSPDVNPGKQFQQDLWVALSGFAIEPLL